MLSPGIDAELTRAEKVVFGKNNSRAAEAATVSHTGKNSRGKKHDKNAAFDKRLLCINRALALPDRHRKSTRRPRRYRSSLQTDT